MFGLGPLVGKCYVGGLRWPGLFVCRILHIIAILQIAFLWLCLFVGLCSEYFWLYMSYQDHEIAWTVDGSITIRQVVKPYELNRLNQSP